MYRQQFFLSQLLFACACCICASAAVAAPIAWGTATNTTSPTDVVTTGTLVEGVNAVPTSNPVFSPSVTINGVVFTNGQPPPLLGNGQDFMTGGATTGDPNFDGFLNDLVSGGGPNRTTITIGNGLLTPGEDYLLQLFFTDERSSGANRVMRFDDDGNPANFVDLIGGGTDGFLGTAVGQFAVGTFTADGISQTLGLTPQGFPNSHLNGYQIRLLPQNQVVPEPTGVMIWAMLAVASTAVFGRRMRRKI